MKFLMTEFDVFEDLFKKGANAKWKSHFVVSMTV